MRLMRKRNLLWWGIPVVLALCLGAVVALYYLPPVHERLAWRVESALASVRNIIKPPQKEEFTPQEQIDAIVQATLHAATRAVPLTPTPTQTAAPTLPGATATPTLTPTFTPTSTPIPGQVLLTGFKHEYQGWNNCGPATLSIALSYWGWKGSQKDTAAVLKPNTRDKNVSPHEMVDYVNEQTALRALERSGGSLETIKRVLAAGFPVIIERGFEPGDEDWMGHYQALVGYDDAKGRFTAQDAYIMPDLPVPYSEVTTYWQNFNYIFVVIYPPEREGELLAALGELAHPAEEYRIAAARAQAEIDSGSGRMEFFAWYNLGTSLVHLQDYAGAAAAYDQAFFIYNQLELDERPWRAVWYQTGPYFAYYYTGRYVDLINLATSTLARTGEPALEESWYWRALARLQTGEYDAAIDDLRTSLKWHPGFIPSIEKLRELGEGG